MAQALVVHMLEIADLLPALRRLDRLLERAVTAAEAAYGPQAADDPHRGMYVSPADAQRLLAQEPGAPWRTEAAAAAEESFPDQTRLGQLRTRYQLSTFDMDVLLLALAPELDLRYERLFGFLQDDVTRRRPTVDLALNLLCTDAADKLERRTHFRAQGPLLRHRILHVSPDPNHVQPPLLAHYLELDTQIVHWLFGQSGLDPRLVRVCRLEASVRFEDLPLTEQHRTEHVAVARRMMAAGRPLRVVFAGESSATLYAAATALAAALGLPLLNVDLARAATSDPELLPLVVRQAELDGAILYLTASETLPRHEQKTVRETLEVLSDHGGITIAAQPNSESVTNEVFEDAVCVRVEGLDFSGRRASWQMCLARAGLDLPDGDLDDLAGRFRLGQPQILRAVGSALAQRAWHATGPDSRPEVSLDDLLAAARAQSSHGLDGLARKLVPRHSLADIVLPEDRLEQLRDIANCVRYRALVYDLWGFERRLSLGSGINALFAGPSGTGKTLAAEILAFELGLDLYQIDLSTVVSKYIGETEKNLASIFAAATASDAMLLFDEADTLFGKRTEVRDAHDRYANLEVGYLLQKMDEYDGIVILATNFRKNMDEAFLRRMHYCVEFPFPSIGDRQRIWENIWPAETPRASDLDSAYLARRFELAGGNIRNIALAASFLAAANGQVVRMEHLLHATRREYQKMGKLVSESDFVDTAPEVNGAHRS